MILQLVCVTTPTLSLLITMKTTTWSEKPSGGIARQVPAHTFAGYSGSNAMMQSTPLFRQLEAGIRAFDIRYALEEDKILLVHGSLTPLSAFLSLPR
jgi:hypothetical protein